MNLYEYPEVTGVDAELVKTPKTSSVDRGDVEDLASLLRRVEDGVRQGKDVQLLRLIFDAQDIVDRIRNDL
jgi:hypothetical protein